MDTELTPSTVEARVRREPSIVFQNADVARVTDAAFGITERKTAARSSILAASSWRCRRLRAYSAAPAPVAITTAIARMIHRPHSDVICMRVGRYICMGDMHAELMSVVRVRDHLLQGIGHAGIRVGAVYVGHVGAGGRVCECSTAKHYRPDRIDP